MNQRSEEFFSMVQVNLTISIFFCCPIIYFSILLFMIPIFHIPQDSCLLYSDHMHGFFHFLDGFYDDLLLGCMCHSWLNLLIGFITLGLYI